MILLRPPLIGVLSVLVLTSCPFPAPFHRPLVPFAQKQPSVSTLAAYDLIFRRHPDVTHLRLLSYRFMQRLRASASRNESLEQLWRRPISPRPIHSEAKYLVSLAKKVEV